MMQLVNKINIIKDIRFSNSNADILKTFNVNGTILYDKNGAPYHRSLYISITDDDNYRLVVGIRKTEKIYGIGIDLIAKKRIKHLYLKNLNLFYPKEQKQILKNNENYLRIFAAKEAAFKAMSCLYRKERRYANMFDFEINKTITVHGKSKQILNKYDGRIRYRLLEDKDYIFTIALLYSL